MAGFGYTAAQRINRFTASASRGELYAGSVGGMPLDLDLSKLKVEPSVADSMNKQLSRLSAEQRLDQMQRLERSLLRLERINVQTLSMLQKLVSAVKHNSTSPAPSDTEKK